MHVLILFLSGHLIKLMSALGHLVTLERNGNVLENSTGKRNDASSLSCSETPMVIKDTL